MGARVRRILVRVALALLVLLASLGAWVVWNLRDRNPGSDFQLEVRPSTTPSAPALRVGLRPRGRSIPISTRPCGWPGSVTAGAATAIHDDLYAVASVIDDGEHRVGLVALDAIGFFHDEVLAVRRAVGLARRSTT